jgi:hypothetical protein
MMGTVLTNILYASPYLKTEMGQETDTHLHRLFVIYDH